MNVVLKEHNKTGRWRSYIACSQNIIIPNIDELFTAIDVFPQTLKDDRRSLVKCGVVDGIKLVAKQPRDKNNRKWARFLTSLGLLGEARRTFVTLIEFKDKGIESLTPYCLLEKRRFGMVIDSWILYHYREGTVSNKTNITDIIELLKQLHDHGYQHTDPNYGNFLLDDDGQLFLIDCKGKPRTGQFSDYYDFFLLERAGLTMQEIEAQVEMDKNSLGYRLAKLYRSYIDLRSAFKKKVGRKRSKSEHL